MGTRQNYWTIHLSVTSIPHKCPSITLTSHQSTQKIPATALCSEEEVYNLLHSLDTTKSNGNDYISAIMLKNTALSITEAVKKMFIISISLGKLSDEWKVSHITPIPKHGDRTNPSMQLPPNFAAFNLKQTFGKTHGTTAYWTHGSSQSNISSSMGVL